MRWGLLSLLQTFLLVNGTCFFCGSDEGDHVGENKICKLNRSVYGLVQAAKNFYDRIVRYLKSIGFEVSKNEPNDAHVSVRLSVRLSVLISNASVSQSNASAPPPPPSPLACCGRDTSCFTAPLLSGAPRRRCHPRPLAAAQTSRTWRSTAASSDGQVDAQE